MSGKTKWKNMVPWLGALAVAIFVVFPLNFVWENAMIATPIIPAQGISTVQAINEFGGHSSEAFTTQRIAMVVSLILLFVVGPVLWVNNAYDDKRIWRRAGWYGGVSLVMMGFLITLAGLGNYLIKGDRRWELAEDNRNTDEIRLEMVRLSKEAMELYWLPSQQGGAARDLRAITMEDLTREHAVDNEYVMRISTADSALTLYGIGRREGNDAGFENANGEQGKIQLAMKVYPARLETEMLQADSLRN